jgi:hypothetical protein
MNLRSAVLVVLIAAGYCSAWAEDAPKEAQGGPRAGPKPTQELFDAIGKADRTLFASVFDNCDTQTLSTLVADDFEMYHDKGGLTATSGRQFVEAIERMCARQKTGEDYRARRELVPGTMKVYPLNNYGAIQVGEHRFYQLLPGKPEKLVEIALFTQVWKQEANEWKLTRVLSYDHRLTE